MTTVIERSAPAAARTELGIVDCDTHNYWNDLSELKAYIDPYWHDQLNVFGARHYPGGGYPRFWDDPVDKMPPSGRRAGSDVAFMGTDHLDANNIAYAILIPGSQGGTQNHDLAMAMARGINDWQQAVWLDGDPRMRASISLATEDPIASAAEIRRVAKDKRFVQVQFSGRPQSPMGQKRYWPIYEACAEFNLPVMTHAFGSAGNPITGAGWGSFYIEDHIGPAVSMQANITSMILEGVFEQFPNISVVSVENGFAWAPALRWRLDHAYEMFPGELRHLSKKPSEYFDKHVFLATQPVEEPEKRPQFAHMFEQWPSFADQLVFSSDYPHWDGDSPSQALPLLRDRALRDKVLRHNARRLYGLE